MLINTFTRTTLSGISSKKKIVETVDLSLSQKVIIQSPGYPDVNYQTDITYKLLVTAPSNTEEISIQIKMDIQEPHGGCEDFLQVCYSRKKVVLMKIILE